MYLCAEIYLFLVFDVGESITSLLLNVFQEDGLFDFYKYAKSRYYADSAYPVIFIDGSSLYSTYYPFTFIVPVFQ